MPIQLFVLALSSLVLSQPVLQSDEQVIRADGLGSDTRIDFDARDIPTITADSEDDAYFAEGLVHARHRLFQMELFRRRSAGELSMIFGGFMLESDVKMKVYQFRRVADRIIDSLAPGELRMLDAYVAGVNAGMSSLEQLPVEYRMLGIKPEPWTRSDTMMVYMVMFDMLTRSQREELSTLGLLEAVDPEYAEFLISPIDRFDAPMIPGTELQETPVPIPGAATTRTRPVGQQDEAIKNEVNREYPGSNNWAVAGSRTEHGGAIVASDPHMPLTVPGLWYRVRMKWPGVDQSGISLAGIPGVVIGSNGHIAWGFTNATADFQDMVIVEKDPDRPDHYLVPGGSEPFEVIKDIVEPRGMEPRDVTVRWTRWGPIVGEDALGRPLALKWIALEPGMVNFQSLNLATARTVDEAIEIGRRWHGPPQNLVVGDSTGRIGWVLTGYLPNRVGFNGRYPVSWADGSRGWDGQIPEDRRPMLVDPESGFLFTANNRTVDPDHAALLGFVWAPGDRARRIRDVLAEDVPVNEEAMLGLQLDTRVERFEPYRELLVQTLRGRKPGESDDGALELIEQWNGCADVDQSAMVILDQWRTQLQRSIVDALLWDVRDARGRKLKRRLVREEPMLQVLQQKPMHLLNPRWDSWEQFLDEQWSQVEADLDMDELPDWGTYNKASIMHPMAAAMGGFGNSRWNIQPHPQPGHPAAVRVSRPRFGASARMVVSPGREELGILHMPAGQSGDPESPYYRLGHDSWKDGTPDPFLPGAPRRVLLLEPAAQP